MGKFCPNDDLVVKVYEVTDPKTGYFPKHQLYRLTQQFQSAAVSVAANIAGSGRESLAESLHFLSIAKGSLAEVEYSPRQPLKVSPFCDPSGIRRAAIRLRQSLGGLHSI